MRSQSEHVGPPLGQKLRVLLAKSADDFLHTFHGGMNSIIGQVEYKVQRMMRIAEYNQEKQASDHLASVGVNSCIRTLQVPDHRESQRSTCSGMISKWLWITWSDGLIQVQFAT